MIDGQYPNKIEKSYRHGKALRAPRPASHLCRLASRASRSASRAACSLLLCTGLMQGVTGACILRARPAGTQDAAFREGGEPRERGPRAAAMGGCAVAVRGGAETALYNPAMLAGAAGGAVLLWTPARFGMTELGAAAAAWTHPFGKWNAAVGVQRYGFDLYAEHRVDCSVALPLGGSLAAGVRVSALHIDIARYGNAIIPMVDAGVRCGIAAGLEIAAVGLALNMPTLDGDERLPAGLCGGLAWTHDGVLLALDLEKESRHPLNMRFGAEYRFLGHVALRCGTATVNRTWTAGLALIRGALRFEYAAAIHTELGATHTVGIGFEP
jgi:hypothetical protein